ncbi:MAG: hypothetical protein HXX12_04655 [Geothrix sp.]|uniref:hypothetical protein n=1 Tax=Geothrix sp. TaxID=1962974 RepID=UPI0017FC1775|nr:hypothetical protein [Geothrix sp.]NWJ40245.1 hypothetical protein [Geothrix sp.]WIL21749.1 MAG: hypothetical protein QOZ81_001019 [Geothrix sp.]
MNDIAFLGYNTLGATLTCLVPAVALGWWRLASIRPVRIWGVTVPSEIFYIIPSGICTAIVIPTTTLMYTLPISVMVAMVIMRASVIVIGRVVDGLQIAQGILDKHIYWEENAAVAFAVLAACIELFGSHSGGFAFLRNHAAVVVFTSYIASYAIRIYIMNYYKNTRPKGAPLDNKAFFAVEQIAATITMVCLAMGAFYAQRAFPTLAGVRQMTDFVGAVQSPHPSWLWASLSGLAFGLVAFFSVFIFMFKGRTATFTGLMNRLTSLVAGTTATLLGHWLFKSRLPSLQNWISLGFVLVAVVFLTRAERRRSQELKAAQEI